MFSLLARLLVLRPLLGVAILGVPVLVLMAIGVATVLAAKLFFFVVLPVGLLVWIATRVFKEHDDLKSD